MHTFELLLRYLVPHRMPVIFEQDGATFIELLFLTEGVVVGIQMNPLQYFFPSTVFVKAFDLVQQQLPRSYQTEVFFPIATPLLCIQDIKATLFQVKMYGKIFYLIYYLCDKLGQYHYVKHMTFYWPLGKLCFWINVGFCFKLLSLCLSVPRRL